MYTSKTAKPPRRDAYAFEIRQLDTAVVTHHHILNVTLPVYQSADLSSCFVRQFAQLASKLRRDDLVWRYAPSVQLFDAPQLIWF